MNKKKVHPKDIILYGSLVLAVLCTLLNFLFFDTLLAWGIGYGTYYLRDSYTK